MPRLQIHCLVHSLACPMASPAKVTKSITLVFSPSTFLYICVTVHQVVWSEIQETLLKCFPLSCPPHPASHYGLSILEVTASLLSYNCYLNYGPHHLFPGLLKES